MRVGDGPGGQGKASHQPPKGRQGRASCCRLATPFCGVLRAGRGQGATRLLAEVLAEAGAMREEGISARARVVRRRDTETDPHPDPLSLGEREDLIRGDAGRFGLAPCLVPWRKAQRSRRSLMRQLLAAPQKAVRSLGSNEGDMRQRVPVCGSRACVSLAGMF